MSSPNTHIETIVQDAIQNRGYDLKDSLRSYQGKDGKRFQPAELKGIHHKIIRMHCQGMTNIEIADHLNITPVTVSYTINSQIGKQQIAVYQASLSASFIETQRHLQELAPIAVLALGDVMIDPGESGSNKIKAALGVLDRTGHGSAVTVNHAQISADDIADIKRLAKMGSNVVVQDAEFTEEDDNV